METDDTICYCFHVSRRKIVNYLKRERPPRASMISDCFGAGTGCGWCIPYLVRLHEEIVAKEAVEADDIDPGEYERMRLQYLRGLREGSREPHRMGGRERGDPEVPDVPEGDAEA